MVDGNGTPAWVKATAQLGVPSVIALGLVYWLTQTATPKLDAVTRLESMVITHIDSTGRADAEMLWYLRAICVNQATSAGDRQRCLPPKTLVQDLLLESLAPPRTP